MNIAIVGCGLIGRKRALALGTDDVLVACCDTTRELAEKFADEFHCTPYDLFADLMEHELVDCIIVAVVNKFSKGIVVDALKRGAHVLAEKPLGRNASEAQEMVSAQQLYASPSQRVLKTGFNHRFHPAVWKAKECVDNGGIGTVFSIRARYGHGGRPGMEREWRASKELCGGGELLDQGVHVIDLVRWFGGEIEEVYGKVETKFWPLEVEDNASAILTTASGVTAAFSVSWTNWKNIFSMEIFGTEGYLRVEGLGGSYGEETLEHGRRKKEGGRPEIETFAFPPEDVSWVGEWKEFKRAIAEQRDPIGSGVDGLKANAVIEAIYRSSASRAAVRL